MLTLASETSIHPIYIKRNVISMRTDTSILFK
ncbi:Uncharacterised protein [Mycobacterium tuberculosis]|nr:Uncharacterised protein [Mycobacterium tuberculosis]CKV60728.1 Uncharacterised protein [Mycobacterium tuberculosis]